MITSLLSILPPRAEPSERAPGRAPVDAAAERRRDGKEREDGFEAMLDADKPADDAREGEVPAEATPHVALRVRKDERAMFVLPATDAEPAPAMPEDAEDLLVAAATADIDVAPPQPEAAGPGRAEAAPAEVEQIQAEPDPETMTPEDDAVAVAAAAVMGPTRTQEAGAPLVALPLDARAATTDQSEPGDAATLHPVARGEDPRRGDEPGPLAAVAGRDPVPASDRAGFDVAPTRAAEPAAASPLAPARAEPIVPPPPAQSHAQAQAQTVIHQIAVAVGRGDAATIDIRLDPPELGRVHIQLNPTERGVQAIVFADRPETGDMLRRNADELARGLSQAGYGEVSLDFASREEPPNDPRGGRWLADLAPANVGETAQEPAGAERPARVPSDGLDIRL